MKINILNTISAFIYLLCNSAQNLQLCIRSKYWFTTLITAFLLVSCQTDSEKADKLRLENKFDEAAELYQKAADEGDAYAMWRLSNAYNNGDGVDWDETKALELLKQSAKAGCEEAKCDLAFAYMYDWYDIGEDEDKGKKMLENLIKTTKNSTVLSKYAKCLFYGNGPYEEDKEKAMRIINKVEDKNNPYYLDFLAGVYIKGTDKIEINGKKAVEYLNKAYENGRKYSAYVLQTIYKSGFSEIKADKTKQIEWLNRGIESNETECMGEMAMLCISEDSTYKDIHNPSRAVDLLKKAGKHGSGKAYFFLGNLYYEGKYLSKDDKNAFDNWEKALNLKYYEAANNLAFFYRYGICCDKNNEKAVELYKLGAENGDGFAAYNLYRYYWSENWGGVKDKVLGKKYLLKAAELNEPWGCYLLGQQYYYGNDLFEKNNDQAFVYMQKAADMGHVDACRVLSYFYENGIGVAKNPQKAKEYKDKTIAKSDDKK